MRPVTPSIVTAALAAGAILALPGDAPGQEMAEGMALNCQPQQPMSEVADRVSPYDSATVAVDGATAKVCYSRPSLRGRTMIGNPEHVPYGSLWRTGANEPTTIHVPFAAEIAGIRVEPGSYSLYTIPREDEDWTLIVNASTSQWGHEGRYTSEVEAREVGRTRVAAERVDEAIETFTIRSPDAGELVLEWEHTRVRVPVRRVEG